MIQVDLFPVAIGKVIRERRRSLGIGQLRFSASAGLHDSALSYIEHSAGKRGPGVVTFARIAVALGMKPSELMAAVEAQAEGKAA